MFSRKATQSLQRGSLISSLCGRNIPRAMYSEKKYIYSNLPNGRGPTDADFDQINNMHLKNPTNSSPPSQWDRIRPEENPAVNRPSQVYQALAPRDGLPPIRVKRVGKKKYWKPTTMVVLLLIVTAIGMNDVDRFKAIKRQYSQEEELHRSALIAFLQSEKDIAYAIEKRAFDEKVMELMKDDPFFIMKDSFYNKPQQYREPLYFPSLVSFEESGLLQRDIDRLEKVTKRREYESTTIPELQALKQRLQQLQDAQV